MYRAHHLVPPQIYVAQTGYNSSSGYYLTVQESDGNTHICLQTFGLVREPLYIHVETTHSNSSDTPPAIGNIYVVLQRSMYTYGVLAIDPHLPHIS